MSQCTHYTEFNRFLRYRQSQITRYDYLVNNYNKQRNSALREQSDLTAAEANYKAEAMEVSNQRLVNNIEKSNLARRGKTLEGEISINDADMSMAIRSSSPVGSSNSEGSPSPWGDLKGFSVIRP